MTIWNAVSRALAGWMMILRSELDWRAQFSLTVPGLVTALVLFFFCAFVAIAMASISSAMPDVYGVLDLLLVHGIWITALFVAIRLTAMRKAGNCGRRSSAASASIPPSTSSTATRRTTSG